MIELLFGIAFATAIPLGVVIATDLLVDHPLVRAWSRPVVGLTAGLSILALVTGRGPIAAVLSVPWWLVAAGVAGASGLALLRAPLAGRGMCEPWRIGATIAAGFLAVGATWLVLDRAAVQPFGFDRTIVLLTAVHFHIAGFVLTLAGSLATRRRPGIGAHLAVAGLVVGMPLTALGFFGLPIVSWLGAALVAGGGIGIGLATVAISRGVADRIARSVFLIGGGTLFVTMPLAVAYATGTTFGIPSLDIPAMAAVHGGLNVVGFAIPAMVGWARMDRSRVDTRGSNAPGPARPGDVMGFNRLPFVAGPVIGLAAVVASVAIVALPHIARIALGIAGLGALVLTSGAVVATWRVFGPDASRRWDWIQSTASDSRRWLNLTTGFDDSTGRLRTTTPGAGTAIDVFDATRSSAAALRRARASFPPSGPSVQIADLAITIEPASVDIVFLLMSAHETHGHDRTALFAAAHHGLVAGGRVVVVEHLRDLANILAFGPGAWHFSRRGDWIETAAGAGLELLDERRLDPWVTGFVFGRGEE